MPMTSQSVCEPTNQGALTSPCDDLDREVYCVLGLPIDVIEMEEALCRIEAAAQQADPYLVSTPNIHFLVTSRSNVEFHESLLMSDLCLADGVPFVWIARLLGVPVARRVAGSDMFEALKERRAAAKIKTFLFGATNNIASAALQHINRSAFNVSCVGWISPGFGSLEQISQEEYIDEINDSGADFLVVAVGAKNAQLWLRRSHRLLRVPVRAHLGAVINFEAGTVKRAPRWLRENGLEWVWRIKEEPHLFSRYWQDSIAVLRLAVTTIAPLMALSLWREAKSDSGQAGFAIKERHAGKELTLQLIGRATRSNIAEAVACFKAALASSKLVLVDLTYTTAIDARFLGLLLMLRKQLGQRHTPLRVVNASTLVRRIFDLNGIGRLIEES